MGLEINKIKQELKRVPKIKTWQCGGGGNGHDFVDYVAIKTHDNKCYFFKTLAEVIEYKNTLNK